MRRGSGWIPEGAQRDPEFGEHWVLSFCFVFLAGWFPQIPSSRRLLYQIVVFLKRLVSSMRLGRLCCCPACFPPPALMLLWISLLAAWFELLGYTRPYTAVSCYLWVLFFFPAVHFDLEAWHGVPVSVASIPFPGGSRPVTGTNARVD